MTATLIDNLYKNKQSNTVSMTICFILKKDVQVMLKVIFNLPNRFVNKQLNTVHNIKHIKHKISVIHFKFDNLLGVN